MQTWRLSLAFSRMQPFKSPLCVGCFVVVVRHLLARKNHTHSPSKPTLAKTAVSEPKTMQRIVEEQSLKSPPAFPTPCPHMLGVNQRQWSAGKTPTPETAPAVPLPQILSDLCGFSASSLQNNTSNLSFKGKSHFSFLFFFFSPGYFFILVAFSQRKVVYIGRSRLNLKLPKMEPRWKLTCRHLPAWPQALTYPALKGIGMIPIQRLKNIKH